MKYKEINLNKELFGDGYLFYDWTELENEIRIYLKSKRHSEICPLCGEVSNSIHSTYSRIIQSIPHQGKKTYLHTISYKYNCLKESCTQKVFTEVLPFAPASQIRTIELTSLILAVSIFLSNEGASKVLGLIGIKISNDTIKRIYDKISIRNEPNIEAVEIDDTGIRKGRVPTTAIYDLEGHHLLALLDGRDADTLKDWLKYHNKIRLVTKDSASTYASAINEILPECIRAADRFHLLQNLIERMRYIFKADLQDHIFLNNL